MSRSTCQPSSGLTGDGSRNRPSSATSATRTESIIASRQRTSPYRTAWRSPQSRGSKTSCGASPKKAPARALTCTLAFSAASWSCGPLRCRMASRQRNGCFTGSPAPLSPAQARPHLLLAAARRRCDAAGRRRKGKGQRLINMLAPCAGVSVWATRSWPWTRRRSAGPGGASSWRFGTAADLSASVKAAARISATAGSSRRRRLARAGAPNRRPATTMTTRTTATTRNPRLRREVGPPEAILRATARSRNRAALDGPSALLRGSAMSRPGGDAVRCHPRPVFSLAVIYGHDPRPWSPDPRDRAPPAAARGDPRNVFQG